MLRHETHTALASFIFEEVLCRWGTIEEIITDNGTAFLAAIEYLKTRQSIPHIPISPYNSRANGIVERRHRDVREALIKATDQNGLSLRPQSSGQSGLQSKSPLATRHTTSHTE
jgi:transposase InsO family protein